MLTEQGDGLPSEHEHPAGRLADVHRSLEALREARKRVSAALVDAALGGGEDHKALESLALDLVTDSDEVMRYSAAQVLGHLARLYRDLDLPRALPALKSLVDQPIAGAAARDAIDDITMYMGDDL